jgi:hypothetical protein
MAARRPVALHDSNAAVVVMISTPPHHAQVHDTHVAISATCDSMITRNDLHRLTLRPVRCGTSTFTWTSNSPFGHAICRVPLGWYMQNIVQQRSAATEASTSPAAQRQQ